MSKYASLPDIVSSTLSANCCRAQLISLVQVQDDSGADVFETPDLPPQHTYSVCATTLHLLRPILTRSRDVYSEILIQKMNTSTELIPHLQLQDGYSKPSKQV